MRRLHPRFKAYLAGMPLPRRLHEWWHIRFYARVYSSHHPRSPLRWI